ncbi:MAG: PD-(D/E)XK nuclease domain-containing protein [Prevotellaceae bacterium]|nr:PD-(D/E)XK nuclease domain-containing protein [Prevotellaceae bacterium]
MSGEQRDRFRHAMKQIYDKKYYEKYAGSGEKIVLLGLAFSGKDVRCRMEALKIEN